VGTPFDFKFTNILLNAAIDNNITAVIIIFDTPIDAAGYYADPVINLNLISSLATDQSSISIRRRIDQGLFLPSKKQYASQN
jgi:hypothetical protein